MLRVAQVGRSKQGKVSNTERNAPWETSELGLVDLLHEGERYLLLLLGSYDCILHAINLKLLGAGNRNISTFFSQRYKRRGSTVSSLDRGL